MPIATSWHIRKGELLSKHCHVLKTLLKSQLKVPLLWEGSPAFRIHPCRLSDEGKDRVPSPTKNAPGMPSSSKSQAARQCRLRQLTAQLADPGLFSGGAWVLWHWRHGRGTGLRHEYYDFRRTQMLEGEEKRRLWAHCSSSCCTFALTVYDHIISLVWDYCDI